MWGGGLNSVTETDESIESRCVPDSWDPVSGKGTHLLDRTDPVTYETNGNYDAITQTTMNKLKEAGFSSVRMPVTAQGLIDAWEDYCNGTVVYKKYNHDAAYPL